MNEDLTNVIGSFIETELDYIEKSNNEIEKLQQENQQLKDRIDKAIEWVYIVQQNENNKHLEPIISIDELDELLEILKGDNND